MGAVPVLRKGDKGVHVEMLQKKLNEAGPPGTKPLAVDGDFGPKTQSAVIYFQQTHLGPGKTYLSDVEQLGVVGVDTWWALSNFSGTPQRSGLPREIPKGTPTKRAKFLEIPLHEHEIGIKEDPDGSNWSTEPEGGIAKYRPGGRPAAWCARFVHWCLDQAVDQGLIDAELRELLDDSGSCRRTMNHAKEADEDEPGVNMWHYRKDGYIPRPGDVFIMQYVDDEGRHTGKGHTGIVLQVELDDRGRLENIVTVDGNSANRVKIGKRSMRHMEGFINLFGDQDEEPTFEFGLIGDVRSMDRDRTR